MAANKIELVQKISNVKMSECVFKEPKINQQGAKIVYVSVPNLDAMNGLLQFPIMNIPFGFTQQQQQKPGTNMGNDRNNAKNAAAAANNAKPQEQGDKWTVSFAVDEKTADGEVVATAFAEFDEAVIKFFTENSAKIFGKAKSQEVISDMYKSPLQPPKKEGFSKLLRTKALVTGDKFNIKFFDEKQKSIDDVTTQNIAEKVPRQSRGRPLIRLRGIYIISGNIYPCLDLKHIQVYPSQQMPSGFVMQIDDDESAAQENKAADEKQVLDDGEQQDVSMFDQ